MDSRNVFLTFDYIEEILLMVKSSTLWFQKTNFLFQYPRNEAKRQRWNPWLNFYFPLFWGMKMYDNEFETKENKDLTKDKIEPQPIQL